MDSGQNTSNMQNCLYIASGGDVGNPTIIINYHLYLLDCFVQYQKIMPVTFFNL